MSQDYRSYAEVPQEIRDSLKYIIMVSNSETGKELLRGYCAEYPTTNITEGPDRLFFTGLLCDTSDRYQGLMLERRLSYNASLEIGGRIVWSIRPIEESEKQAWEKKAAEVSA